MKKFIALVLAFVFVLGLVGCKPDEITDIPELVEITDFTQEQLEEKLIGLSQEEIYRSWGDPNGHLSGFWGDIWRLDNERDEHITVYYDKDGIVEHVLVSNLSE